MNAQDSVKNIKTFDGTDKHSNLENFLSSCEEAFEYHKEVNTEKLLLKHILKIKLEGSAFTCTNRKIINTFKDLKTVLNQKFKKQSSEDALFISLSQIRQDKNEKVLAYSNRVEDIVSEINTNAIEAKNDDEAKVLEEFIERLAKTFFENGLKPEIKKIIRSQNHKTLEKSIRAATLEELELHNLFTNCSKCYNSGHNADDCKLEVDTTKNIVCLKCNNPGHYANKCKLNLKYIEPSNENYLNREINNISISRLCTYCKMANHSTKDCGKKKRNNTNITSNNKFKKEINNISTFRFCIYCKMKNHSTEECGKYKRFNNHNIDKKRFNCIGSTGLNSKINLPNFNLNFEEAQVKDNTFLFDTGAQISIINKNKLKNDIKLHHDKIKLKGVGKYEVKTIGFCYLTIKLKNKDIKHKFYVVPEDFQLSSDGIIGFDFMETHNIIMDCNKKLIYVDNN